MSRKAMLKRKRLERNQKMKMRERTERLRTCLNRDACEQQNCVYYTLPEEVLELLEWVDSILDD